MSLQEKLRERRKIYLNDKFREKTFTERWATMRAIAGFTTYFFQVITAILAITLPAYAVQIIFDSWVAGFAAGAFIVALFEYFKRKIQNESTLSYYRNGVVNWLNGVGSLIFIAASVVMSVFAVPILINEFSPMPPKPIESEVIAAFESKKEDLKAEYEAIKAHHLQQADKIHSQSNWGGVTSRDARPAVLSHRKAAKATQDTLTALLASTDKQAVAAWDEALMEWQEATDGRKTEKQVLGYVLGGVTLGVEILFLLLVGWCNYYDAKEYYESNSQSKSKSTKAPIKANTPTGKSKAKQRPMMGFKNEGAIVTSGIVPKIIMQGKEELKEYSEADIRNMMKTMKQGGESWNKWTGALNKLQNYKNEQS